MVIPPDSNIRVGNSSLELLDRCVVFFFFFQAEDGIRDYKVTGVQTCALPISGGRMRHRAVLVLLTLVLGAGCGNLTGRSMGQWTDDETISNVVKLRLAAIDRKSVV